MLIHSSRSSRNSSGWKAVIRTLAGNFYYYSGLFGLHLRLCRWRKRDAVILMLHRVLPSASPVLKEHLALRPMITTQENLLELLRFLKKHFQFMSLEDYVSNKPEKREASQLPACILTFDDGYRDFSQYAWPALQARGVPATMFLPTALIGTTHCFWWDRLYHAAVRFNGPIPDEITDESKVLLEAIAGASSVDRLRHVYKLVDLAQDWPPNRVETLITRLRDSDNATKRLTEANALMNWDDVRALQRGGVRFGSHTRHHLNLKTASPEELLEEVDDSKRELETAIRSEVTSFSFPGGHMPQQAIENLTRSGYTDACTTRPGLSRREEGAFQIRRVSVWDGILEDFRGRFSPGVFALNLTRADWF